MKQIKKILQAVAVAAFWIAVWWGASALFDRPMLFPSPYLTVKRLIALLGTGDFYRAVFISVRNILIGILIAVPTGVILAMLTHRIRFLRSLIHPAVAVIRSTPVVSFIILAMILMGANRIPSFITVLIVLPVIWTNLDVGLSKMDRQLDEVATVFGFSPVKRLRLLVLPSIKPYFLSACRTSLGLAWKAGIAAEILAMPAYSIGTMIGEAKQYVLGADLFAWTLTAVLFSVLFEFVFCKLFDRKTESEVMDHA